MKFSARHRGRPVQPRSPSTCALKLFRIACHPSRCIWTGFCVSASNVVADTVERTLADKGFRCASVNHYFGYGTYFVPDGRVEVVVECIVDLSDVGLLPVPGSHTISARATEPIDQYRVVE